MEKVEDENDESWLYGNSEQRDGEQPQDDELVEAATVEDDSNAVDDQPDGDVVQFENGENHDESSQMDDSMQDAFHDDEIEGVEGGEEETKEKADSLLSDDDDDEDDVQVTINAIKRYDIKQRGQAAPAANASGVKLAGKFNMEEFESVGVIAGVPAHEYSIDSLDEKPWRKPGADITDYFNYGFNEDTWRAYCERQKRFRLNESGVGLASLSSNMNQQPPPQNGVGSMKRMMPLRRGIDVVGSSGRPDDRGGMMRPPNKENVIQVMTADRREYSRMNRSFDMNEPGGEPNFFEEGQFDYMNYEPTQDSQWQNNSNWGAPSVKELTPGMNLNMPPPGMGGPMMGPGGPGGLPMMGPMGPMGMNMPPNMGPPMMGMPPNINPNGPRGGGGPVGAADRDRGRDRDRERFDRDRAERELRRRRSKSRSRERSRRPRSRSRDRSRRPRSRSRERSRRPRSKSLERRRTRSPTLNRDNRNRSRENLRGPRRSKSRDKRSKSRDRDRDRKKDKERERPEKPKEEEKPEKKADKESKDDRDHKKEKKKKKDKEKSDSD